MSTQVDLKDVATIITAIFAGIAAVIGAMNRRTARGVKQAVVELNLSVNGRLTELLAVTREAAHSKGLREGQDENKKS